MISLCGTEYDTDSSNTEKGGSALILRARFRFVSATSRDIGIICFMVFNILWYFINYGKKAAVDASSLILVCTLSNNPNLLLRKPIQFIHQRIDPNIRRIDLLLHVPHFLIGFGFLQILVQ